ncbi:MAG: gliding motility lipoprotein GldH [Prevotella sp.]|nr:gliding motility lipoprotein GldH [Candidatus Prevotella equi]
MLNIGHIAVSILMAICLFASCSNDTVYHHYENIDAEGWYAMDSITFHVDSVPATGEYITFLCLRMTSKYPYRNFAALVSQYNLPMQQLSRRMVTTTVQSEEGVMQGKGQNLYTYEIPVFKRHINKDDSLRIVVRHRMRRETIPGLMDVGIKIEAE